MPSLSHFSTVLACHFTPNPLVSSRSDLSATHDPSISLHQFHCPTQGCTSISLSGSWLARIYLYCDGAVAILPKPLVPNRYITEKYQSSLHLHDSSFTIDVLPRLHRSAAKYNWHAICFVFAPTLQASRSHLLQWKFTLRTQPNKRRNFFSRRPAWTHQFTAVCLGRLRHAHESGVGTSGNPPKEEDVLPESLKEEGHTPVTRISLHLHPMMNCCAMSTVAFPCQMLKTVHLRNHPNQPRSW